MILIVGETFKDLGASERGKALRHHSFDGLTGLQKLHRRNMWLINAEQFASAYQPITLLPILSVACLVSLIFSWRMEVSCRIHRELAHP